MREAFIRYRLPILAGFLIGTSYIPFPPWALFFCQTPLFLFWWLHAENKKQAFFGGWITQFILNLIGFHWIAYTAIEFGHFPLFAGLLTLLGFACVAHLYYPLAGWLATWFINRAQLRGPSRLFVYFLTFALLDRVFPMIFPWHLGYPWLWAGLPGAQFADVIGFDGLNVITTFVNMCLAWAIYEGLLSPNASRRRGWMIAIAAASVVIVINLLGLGRAERWRETDANLNVLAIQGNIGNFEKFMVEFRSEFAAPITDKYIELSKKGLTDHPDAHLIMWPETAFPSYLDSAFLHQPLQSKVRSLLRERGVSLLTGAYSTESGSKETYNGLFFIDKNGNLPSKPYRKSILLVFGETFPFSEYIPYMQKLFPEQGSFARGPGPTVRKIRASGAGLPPEGAEVALGFQICYEGLYPWFSAELARGGAHIIANVTNDSWFWRPFEPNQHLYMTLARAIEFRRPLVRATNTGITTAVLASGEILEKSPLGSEWAGLFRVKYLQNPPHTIYENLVSMWPVILSVSLVLIIGIGLVSERGRKNKTNEL